MPGAQLKKTNINNAKTHGPLSERIVDGVQKEGGSGNQIQSWTWDLDDAIEAAQGIQNTSLVIGDIDDLFHEAMTSIGIQLSAIQKEINAIKERYGVTNKGGKNEKSHCEDKHKTYTYTEAMMRADGEQQYNKTILFNKKCDTCKKKIKALLEETRMLQCMLPDGMKSDASILALEERQAQILFEAMNAQALKNTVREHGKATSRDYGKMIEHLDKQQTEAIINVVEIQARKAKIRGQDSVISQVVDVR